MSALSALNTRRDREQAAQGRMRRAAVRRRLGMRGPQEWGHDRQKLASWIKDGKGYIEVEGGSQIVRAARLSTGIY